MSLRSWIRGKIRRTGRGGPVSEFQWAVTISDGDITCMRPDGKVESVPWDDLELVAIITTDDGPLLPDVFWLLKGSVSGCIVPLGAAGADAMLQKLQALPGFDNEAVVQAMSSATSNRFVCWQRDGPPGV